MMGMAVRRTATLEDRWGYLCIMGLGPSEADRPRPRSLCHLRILAAVGLLNPDDLARGELPMMLTRNQSPIRDLYPMMYFVLRL